MADSNFSNGEEITIHIDTGYFVAGKVWGPKNSKQRVIATHGWLDNCNSFDFLAPVLAQNGLRIIAIDWIGHGLSPHKPKWCNLYYTDYITQMIDVADALQWDTFTVIGHSMGAGIGSMLAATVPHRVERLICLDFIGILSREQDQVTAIQFAMQTRETINSRKPNLYTNKQAIFDKLKGNNPWITDEAAHRLLERSIVSVVSNGEQCYKLRHDPRLIGPSIFTLREVEVLILLDQIKCPVLVIWGTTSAQQFQINKNWTQIMQERMKHIKNLNSLNVAGSHHFHLEVVESFYKDILDLMNKETQDNSTTSSEDNQTTNKLASSSSTSSPNIKCDNHNQIAEQGQNSLITTSPTRSKLYKYLIPGEEEGDDN